MRRILSTVVVLGTLVWAAGSDEDEQPVTLIPSGAVGYEVKQVMNTNIPVLPERTDSALLKGHVLQGVRGEFELEALIMRRLSLHVGYRGQISQPTTTIDHRGFGSAIEFASGITEGKAVVRFGDIEEPPFVLTGGYFKYRYNTDAQNLGEYLLRSGTYPGFLYSSGYEYTSGEGFQQVGFLLRTTYFENFVHDLLLTSEINIIPNYDISLSYIGRFDLQKVLTLGAGVMFNRLISVRELNTTPEQHAIDSITQRSDGTYDTTTIMYTHRGVKLMGRLVFDPKPLFSPSRLGERDLRLYIEAALLGVKNYPIYYEEVTERIPVMVGLTLPVFGLLDVAAVEAEWYGSPWKNNPYNRGIPYPKDPLGSDDPSWHPGSKDDIKWSVSLQKSVVEGLMVHVLAASDHTRLASSDPKATVEENFARPEHWYWSLLLLYSF